jgi:two-component system, NarL family, nitrate/nitrite response regulator NarL
MHEKNGFIRIVIADDHRIFRDGLGKLLSAQPDFRVEGETGDGDMAVQLVQELRPDILLLDLAMRPDGLESLRKLARQPASTTRAILLAAAIENSQIVEALRLGARGMVLKEAATAELFKCIRTVMAGQYWIGHEAVADLVKLVREITAPAPKRDCPKNGLTPRELQVIATIVTGYSNKEIAQKFSISEDTVKHHLTNIFDKLGTSSRLELATYAISHHLVDGWQC